MRTALGSACLVLGSMLAAPASADDIGPPPATCPAGTRPDASHAGPHCALSAPCTMTPCPGGLSCAEAHYCVQDVPCGGLGAMRPGAPTCTERHVVGTCDGAAGCSAGATCVAHAVCGGSARASVVPSVPPSTAPAAAAPAEAPGGCSASHGGGLGPMVVLGLLLALRRRR